MAALGRMTSKAPAPAPPELPKSDARWGPNEARLTARGFQPPPPPYPMPIVPKATAQADLPMPPEVAAAIHVARAQEMLAQFSKKAASGGTEAANGSVQLSAPALNPLPNVERLVPQAAFPKGAPAVASSIAPLLSLEGALPSTSNEAGARAGEQSDGFKVGDRVEYWSSTHSKWVGAHVRVVNRGRDGLIKTYDLDAKPKAAVAHVRAVKKKATKANVGVADASDLADEAVAKVTAAVAATSSGKPGKSTFRVGQRVFYWSKKTSKWLEASIQEQRVQDGYVVYDLKCNGLHVRGAPPERLRPRGKKKQPAAGGGAEQRPLKRNKAQSKPAESAEDEDESVWAALEEAIEKPSEQASQQATKKKALPVGRSKAHSAPLVFRKRSASENSPPPGSLPAGARSNRKSGRGAALPATGRKHATGDRVEFCNADGVWQAAVVKSVCLNAQGAVMFYDLDCKKAVKPASVRRASRKSAAGGTAQGAAPESEVFSVGERVRYWSGTHGKWVPAKITEVHKLRTGALVAYDLNLKPRADPSLVRNSSTAADAPAPPAASEAEFQVGDKAQYWSKSANKWMGAKVQAKRVQDGITYYDLQCKEMLIQGATMERLQPVPF